jgi:hypothetical protein
MRLAIMALAACSSAPARVTAPVVAEAEPEPTVIAVPIAIAPAAVGARRTVRYRFDSHSSGFRGAEDDLLHGEAVCTELVLAETVTRADGERELELAVEITGGTGAEICDVGRTLTVVAPADDAHNVAVTADAVLQPRVSAAIESLHGDLGRRNGAFAVYGGLPWAQPTRRVELAGVAYLDSELQTYHRFGPMPSIGTATSTATLRRRERDRALVCASYAGSSQGSNFEYGGWSTSAFESIAVDDGAGMPDCP